MYGTGIMAYDLTHWTPADFLIKQLIDEVLQEGSVLVPKGPFYLPHALDKRSK